MSENVVLYCEKLPTEGMETLIMELCPPELDLRFLYPVKNGKKGDFEDANYILASICKIGKAEIDRAKGLKLIHVPATGYNHVDLEYAKSKGIPVCNSAGENATTTAEFTIALMLACMRRLSQIDHLVKKGEWHSWTWRHDQYELRGKTVGIVGGGAIGKGVMQRLQGWECTLIYSDPYRMPIEKEQELHCEYVDLDTLLERSDVVSLHCPLTNETRGMMGAEQFKKMKKNAIIVNEARGAVIDDAALVEALRTGEIWGAALDVWEKEPLDPEDPLCKFEKVITTSHLGAATRETVIRCFSIGYNNILRLTAEHLRRGKAYLIRGLNAARTAGVRNSAVANARFGFTVFKVAPRYGNRRAEHRIGGVYRRAGRRNIAYNKRQILLNFVFPYSAVNAVCRKALCGANSSVCNLHF